MTSRIHCVEVLCITRRKFDLVHSLSCEDICNVNGEGDQKPYREDESESPVMIKRNGNTRSQFKNDTGSGYCL